MNDATQNHDRHTPISDTNEVSSVTKPWRVNYYDSEGRPAEDRFETGDEARARVTYLTARNRPAHITVDPLPLPCSKPWCTMTDPDEHAEYHGGDSVQLSEGWTCHVAEDRGGRPRIYFEGHFPEIDFHHEFDVDAMRVLSIRWALETAEANAAMHKLLEQIACGNVA